MAPRREDLGSWLEGTPAGEPAEAGPDAGRAPLWRRVVGVVVDWFASMSIAALVARDPDSTAPGILAADPTVTLVVFAASTVLLVATLGTTLGHRLAGLRVVHEERPGGPPGLLPALVRTALLCLVVPAVVWDRAGRGMHDTVARTRVVAR